MSKSWGLSRMLRDCINIALEEFEILLSLNSNPLGEVVLIELENVPAVP
jgi:hypothetical protein